MILRFLVNPLAQTTRQTLADQCCRNPDFSVSSEEGRYRGAKKDTALFCLNCSKTILTIITRRE